VEAMEGHRLTIVRIDRILVS